MAGLAYTPRWHNKARSGSLRWLVLALTRYTLCPYHRSLVSDLPQPATVSLGGAIAAERSFRLETPKVACAGQVRSTAGAYKSSLTLDQVAQSDD